MARGGGRVTYVCYEHTEEELLVRLLLMEAGLESPDKPPSARPTRRAHAARAELDPRMARAMDTLAKYGERLRLVRGDSSQVGSLDPGVDSGEPPAVLVLDYLQKVPSRVPLATEAERVTEVVERLKDHAMEYGVPVLAVVASDRSGLEGARVRMQDMRGSTAIVYEADVALMLNDKRQVVARHHLVYGTGDSPGSATTWSAPWRRTGPVVRRSTSSCASGSRTGASHRRSVPSPSAWSTAASTSTDSAA